MILILAIILFQWICITLGVWAFTGILNIKSRTWRIILTIVTILLFVSTCAHSIHDPHIMNHIKGSMQIALLTQ